MVPLKNRLWLGPRSPLVCPLHLAQFNSHPNFTLSLKSPRLHLLFGELLLFIVLFLVLPAIFVLALQHNSCFFFSRTLFPSFSSSRSHPSSFPVTETSRSRDFYTLSLTRVLFPPPTSTHSPLPPLFPSPLGPATLPRALLAQAVCCFIVTTPPTIT